MIGVFVTAFYTFRMFFLAFHGPERFATHAHAAHDDHGHDDHHGGTPHESPWVVTVPLVLLAIPSIYTGWTYVEPMLLGNFFGNSIVISEEHKALWEFKAEWHGIGGFIQHGVLSLPFWLALAGIAAAGYLYLVNTALPARIAQSLRPVYTILMNNYYFDRFNDWFFAAGSRRIGTLFANFGDGWLIEGVVNGSARMVGWWSRMLRQMQSGYVYHYAFTMIIGLFALLTWWVVRP